MQSNTSSVMDEAPTVTDGAAALTQVDAAARMLHATVTSLIDGIIDVRRSGTVESLAGMSLDLWLGNAHAMPGAERGMLQSAADVLPTLPVTWGLSRPPAVVGPDPRDRLLRPAAAPRRARRAAVLLDGARPLACGRKVNAANLPDDIRDAVGLRDRGCRFPGSRAPLGWTDAHHIDGQQRGHHPDRLIRLSRRGHRLVHDHRWTITLDPATGEATFTRNGHSFTTLPWGTRLRKPKRDAPQDDPDPPDG